MVNMLSRNRREPRHIYAYSSDSSSVYEWVMNGIHGLAPAYLSALEHVHTPVKALRSSNQGLLDVPRARLINKGDRAFSVVAPN